MRARNWPSGDIGAAPRKVGRTLDEMDLHSGQFDGSRRVGPCQEDVGFAVLLRPVGAHFGARPRRHHGLRKEVRGDVPNVTSDDLFETVFQIQGRPSRLACGRLRRCQAAP